MPGSSRSTCAWIVIGLVLLSATPCLAQSGDRRQEQFLELKQVAAIGVPDSLTASGAELSSRDLLLFWDAATPEVQLWDGRQVRTLRHKDLVQPLHAAFSSQDSTIEVLDGELKKLFRFSITGDVLSIDDLGGFGEYVSATKLAGLRYIAEAADSNRIDIVRIEVGEQPIVVASVEAPGESRGVHLTSGRSEILLTFMRAPFSITRLALDGKLLGSFAPDTSVLTSLIESKSAGGTQPGLWISLPVVALDSGYLQTLSDLRSDERWIFLYNQDGSIVRKRRLEVPLGFVSAVPREQLLLGARRTDVLELVIYEWQWTD